MIETPILLSSAYLPPITYFAILMQYPVYIENHETFPKQTYRNRCHIYSDKGLMTLSIPVTKPSGNHTQTNQVQILNLEKWHLKHWRAIQAAYESSPYFLYYKDDIAPYYQDNEISLFDFNKHLIYKISELIGFEPEIRFTEKFEKQPQNMIDLRNVIHPKTEHHLTSFPSYLQVFDSKHGFLPDLSIVDLLFNMGPETKDYLTALKFKFPS
ncbi:MAG: WbqC family protein [Bacteroidales bacterium]|nr:WbqC family protein [Bacteroidales bacterium]